MGPVYRLHVVRYLLRYLCKLKICNKYPYPWTNGMPTCHVITFLLLLLFHPSVDRLHATQSIDFCALRNTCTMISINVILWIYFTRFVTSFHGLPTLGHTFPLIHPLYKYFKLVDCMSFEFIFRFLGAFCTIIKLLLNSQFYWIE